MTPLERQYLAYCEQLRSNARRARDEKDWSTLRQTYHNRVCIRQLMKQYLIRKAGKDLGCVLDNDPEGLSKLWMWGVTHQYMGFFDGDNAVYNPSGMLMYYVKHFPHWCMEQCIGFGFLGAIGRT